MSDRDEKTDGTYMQFLTDLTQIDDAVLFAFKEVSLAVYSYKGVNIDLIRKVGIKKFGWFGCVCLAIGFACSPRPRNPNTVFIPVTAKTIQDVITMLKAVLAGGTVSGITTLGNALRDGTIVFNRNSIKNPNEQLLYGWIFLAFAPAFYALTFKMPTMLPRILKNTLKCDANGKFVNGGDGGKDTKKTPPGSKPYVPLVYKPLTTFAPTTTEAQKKTQQKKHRALYDAQEAKRKEVYDKIVKDYQEKEQSKDDAKDQTGVYVLMKPFQNLVSAGCPFNQTYRILHLAFSMIHSCNVNRINAREQQDDTLKVLDIGYYNISVREGFNREEMKKAVGEDQYDKFFTDEAPEEIELDGPVWTTAKELAFDYDEAYTGFKLRELYDSTAVPNTQPSMPSVRTQNLERATV
jgi:hypothetical protein